MLPIETIERSMFSAMIDRSQQQDLFFPILRSIEIPTRRSFLPQVLTQFFLEGDFCITIFLPKNYRGPGSDFVTVFLFSTGEQQEEEKKKKKKKKKKKNTVQRRAMAIEQQQQQQKLQVPVFCSSKVRHINAHHHQKWKDCLSFAAELLLFLLR
jgi:hypothetical protein